jgi:glycosyltransferase involved in cell wall biosynthesis
MASPRVSIVISAYNVADFIAATVEAALRQTYPDCSVTVVDDGSSDDTPQVLARYEDHARVVRQANFGGPSRPRNVGIASSDGDVIALCDGDDIMEPDAIARAVDVLTRLEDVDVVWGDFAVIDETGDRTGALWSGKYTDFREDLLATDLEGCYRLPPRAAFANLLRGLFIGTSSVVVRRAALESVGPFDETLRNGDDRDMWLRLARGGHGFAYRDAVAYRYRIHRNSVSRRGHERLPGVIRVLEKQLGGIEDADLRADVRDRILKTRIAYGVGLGRAGRTREARATLWRCFRERPSWAPLRGLLATTLRSR